MRHDAHGGKDRLCQGPPVPQGMYSHGCRHKSGLDSVHARIGLHHGRNRDAILPAD